MMIKKFAYTPILGWSVSRYDKFKLCKRQYFYEYYGRYDKAYAKIKNLKKLTSIPLAIGTIVHDIIKVILERLLKSDEEIDVERFLGFTKMQTERYCHENTFIEVYYNEVSYVNPDELFEKIEKDLMNFLNSDRYNWIKVKAIINKDNWVIEPPGYGEFRLSSMKVYCKVDFLFPINNEIYIIDWKTGKIDNIKHKKQLLGYVSWVSYNLKTNPERITPIIAYLKPSYREIKIKFNDYDIEDFIAQIKEETEEMYSLCRDVEENIPKDKKEFTKTRYKKICDYCNYRELCYGSK
ncbi:PD-(D/E)XK nuclease family protein [candidate division WOR-3 bacterium]|nr:PD-(D/E)XK nuclease family protein [candidate division WOR-3 bacterium]